MREINVIWLLCFFLATEEGSKGSFKAVGTKCCICTAEDRILKFSSAHIH